MAPGRAAFRQNQLDIAERGGNLFLDPLGDLQVIVPAALAGRLYPVPDLDGG
jgi:hypothetical protein